VIVKLIGAPVQPPILGVTVMVPLIGAAVALVAMKPAILPEPLAAKPIAVLVFVQLYTVPATVPLKLTAAVSAPVHTDWLPTAATVGVGLTVIVNVIGVPPQLIPPLI